MPSAAGDHFSGNPALRSPRQGREAISGARPFGKSRTMPAIVGSEWVSLNVANIHSPRRADPDGHTG